MIIKLLVGVMIVALIVYYLLVMLQVFGVIHLTSDDEEVSWIPFYYLFKKERKKDESLSTAESKKKRTKAKSNRLNTEK